MMILISINILDFDTHGFFLEPSSEAGRNVITFGVDMSLSKKIDNRKKDILVPGKGATEGLERTMSVEKMYSINFTENNKKFVYVYIIMEQIVIYLLMVKKFINSILKDS